MSSTTSGTTSFSLDVDEILEQALEPLGKEHTSGIEASKARRVLNLVLIQLQNKNIPLSKLDYVTQALSSDTATYTLNAAYQDVLKVSVNHSSFDVDTPLSRVGLKEYQDLPKKAQTGIQPNMFTTERGANAVDITFWPVPDNALCTAKMLVSKRIEDITAAYQKIDLPVRYLPLLIKWLTYELSLTRPGIPDTIKDRAKQDLNEAMPDTFDEDRERTDFIIVPGGLGVWGR